MKLIGKIGVGCLVLCVIGCGGDSGTPRKDPSPLDKDTLHGEWTVVSETILGTFNEDSFGRVWAFKGNEVRLGGMESAEYEIDTTTNPNQINVTIPEHGTMEAIYALSGDELRMCFSLSSKMKRPTDFSSTRDNGHRLLVFKRKSENIESDPNNAIAQYVRATKQQLENDYDNAIESFTEAIRLEPNYAKAYFGRGRVRLFNGDHDKAIEDFAEAIRIDPQLRGAYKYRGLVWDLKDQYDKAISDFTEAIRLEPKDWEAYKYRGQAFQNKGDKAKAEADFKEAKRLDPDIELDNE